ncbi:hypothetical protein GII33_11415 [Gordonia pseudamarae]|uniref:Serine/threonine protein kinase n=1 Tax=Gordonia pseudamarae TaxID=2831662 RepID=A0ABX6IHS1_9ACTN|nr:MULTISPECIES: hypothetical protein [Gordonia]MBD0021342.1 hypothetical protein [Gordonia sp. (in: high G+C Gram-positive bacteria)]QHN26484.1 hypothetical protein GII33_11415 [Gordonia pseudamarae]QHN35379.1 hypothetical protein GII31_11235 [Gordonia pseudamarae]
MTGTERLLTPSWPSCAVGAWAAAWKAGACSPDDVIDMFGRDGYIIDDRTGRLGAITATTLLPIIRTATALSVRLPGPGDPHGLPPGPATTAAFEAGEVLLLDDPAGTLALIPREHDGLIRWAVHEYTGTLPTPPSDSAAELEYELRQAVSEAAGLLSAAGPRLRATPADLRTELRTLTERLRVDVPPHEDTRVSRILDSAAQIEAIVTIAHSSGAAFGDTAGTHSSGDVELRRLATLTRRARAAAVNQLISRQLADVH